MSDAPKEQPWVDHFNGLVVIGIIAVLIAFLPAFAGGEVRPLPLLIGVMLIIGGVIVNTIKSRP
jgi:drug/metabolite transporter (DMT)-like permease